MIGDKIRANADYPIQYPEKTAFIVAAAVLLIVYVLVYSFA